MGVTTGVQPLSRQSSPSSRTFRTHTPSFPCPLQALLSITSQTIRHTSSTLRLTSHAPHPNRARSQHEYVRVRSRHRTGVDSAFLGLCRVILLVVVKKSGRVRKRYKVQYYEETESFGFYGWEDRERIEGKESGGVHKDVAFVFSRSILLNRNSPPLFRHSANGFWSSDASFEAYDHNFVSSLALAPWTK